MQSLFKPTWKKSLTVIIVSLLIIMMSFTLWANATNPIMPQATEALQSDSAVTVVSGDFLTFEPSGQTPTRGYILYPGGRVQAEAYAPLARAIAEEGYFTAIVYAPLNLAFFGVGAADAVIEAHPEIDLWAVGGHSLGGVAASLYATQNDNVNGLIIMASYPANDALANRDDLVVASIYATNDGLTSVDDVLNSAGALPAGTVFTAIEGGNHGYFGYYGDQDGDNEATVSREQFLEELVTASVALLNRME